jgi:hypothetical protein
MKPGWWIAGIVAAIAVGGTWLYLRRFRGDDGVFHFVDDESALKNFGAFPPEVPEDEFDGVNFIF